MQKFIFLISICLISLSCKLSTDFNETVVIPDREWEYSNRAEFVIDEIDTVSSYDLYLRIRHDKKYEFSNLFLKVYEHQENSIDTHQRIELTLAEADGKWRGENAGNLYMHEYLLKENYKFSDTSSYRIQIEQNIRQNPILHIADVGVRFVKHTKNTP